jgi:hypothetical protein
MRYDDLSLLATATVLLDAIKELGSVPNGYLYANVSAYMNLREYDRIIAALKDNGLIKEENHVLTYIGK